MAFTILSASGTIESLTFDYNETSAKQAKYYAGLKRDTDNAINVITTSLVPNTSIAYENGSGWCSATLGTTESNTGKPINVSCSSNTGTSSRACRIYLKYDNKTTSGYIYVTQKSSITVRVWNQENSKKTCDQYIVLLCKDHGPGRWHGVILDTYNKVIPANGYIDVSDTSELTLKTDKWTYYTTGSAYETVNVTDTISLSTATSSFYYSFYISASSTLTGTTLNYTGGASPSYYVGTSKDTMPTNTWTTSSLPASITYYKQSSVTYKDSYAYINTYASSVNSRTDHYWILIGYSDITSGKIYVTAYQRQQVQTSSNTNVIEAWSRTSYDNTLTLAKKISRFSSATSVYQGSDVESSGAFGHGDGYLYLWLLRGSSLTDAYQIYSVGGQTDSVIQIGNKSSLPDPITSGIYNIPSSSPTFTNYTYGTWYSTFQNGKTYTRGTTRYIIPTFNMSGHV